MGFDYGIGGFGVFGAVFTIMFILIAGVIFVGIIKGISTWNSNNHSPRLTVAATVVSKRMNVSHHRHGNAGDPSGAHGFHTTSSTAYYVTFQVESGDRMELAVNGREYGMLAERDYGKLSFQGTRYLGFERDNDSNYGS